MKAIDVRSCSDCVIIATTTNGPSTTATFSTVPPQINRIIDVRFGSEDDIESSPKSIQGSGDSNKVKNPKLEDSLISSLGNDRKDEPSPNRDLKASLVNNDELAKSNTPTETPIKSKLKQRGRQSKDFNLENGRTASLKERNVNNISPENRSRHHEPTRQSATSGKADIRQTSGPNPSAPAVENLNSIGGPLYRFNYTLGFHGHYEEGDRQGNKVGGYHVVDRNGVKYIITYVANGQGYRRKVIYGKVGESDTPHEDTEKMYGAKGVEFKWFN